MSFNIFTNNNTAFSVSNGFQNYTSLISSFNNLGLTTSSITIYDWVKSLPFSTYNCMAINSDGSIQVACTNDTIFLYKNCIWTSIYTVTGINFSSICLSDNGNFITASDFNTGLYVSINGDFTFVSIINIDKVYMSKDGSHQTVNTNLALYTTTTNWISYSTPTLAPGQTINTFCMSDNGLIQIAFLYFRGILSVYVSLNYGSTFNSIVNNIQTIQIFSCSCSSNGNIVTALSSTGSIYVSTTFPISATFISYFNTNVPVGSIFSISMSFSGEQQWCVIGGVLYNSFNTGITWSPVTNLPSTDLVTSVCISSNSSTVTIISNTIYYLGNSYQQLIQPPLIGFGQPINYVISLDKALGL